MMFSKMRDVDSIEGACAVKRKGHPFHPILLVILLTCAVFFAGFTANAQASAPQADAGIDRAVLTGSTLLLDGSASILSGEGEADDALSYSWAYVSGPADPSLTAGDTPRASVTLVEAGTYRFSLTATNAAGEGSVDEVEITAADESPAARPVADVGLARFVETGLPAILDGSGSYAPSGVKVSFAWTIVDQPSGSLATLDDSTSPRPVLTPDLAGDYSAELIVTDNLGAVSAPQTVILSTANVAPVAFAGGDRVRTIGQALRLDPEGSYDANGDRLEAAWSLLYAPVSSSAQLSEDVGGRFVLTPDVSGDYVVQLAVTDSEGAVSYDTALIYADDGTGDTLSANIAPIANAGLDRAALAGGELLLDGSQSSDANGDALSYQWSVLYKRADSFSQPLSPNSVRSAFTPDIDFLYIVQLAVTDSGGLTSYDTVVLSPEGLSPLAISGGPDAQADGAILEMAAALDGSTSLNGNGSMTGLSYDWSILGLSKGTSQISDASGVMTDVSFPEERPGEITDASSIAALGLLRDYTLISFGELNAHADSLGRVLVGGDVQGPSATFGTAIVPANGIDVLTVIGEIKGGAKNINNGGNVRIKGKAKSRLNFNGGGQLIKDTSLSISPTEQRLKTLSNDLLALPTNSTLSLPNGQPGPAVLEATPNLDGVAVFDVANGNTLFKNNKVQQIELEANGAETIIVNVGGNNINFNKGNFTGAITTDALSQKIIWNFYEASQLKIFRDFEGTILAPYAYVHNMSKIDGSVVGARVLKKAPIGFPVYGGTGLDIVELDPTHYALAQLAVTDTANPGFGPSYATTVLTTGNKRPLAQIIQSGGPDPLTPGIDVGLSAAGSSDSDNDVLSYSWSLLSKPEGSQSALSSPVAANNSITPDAVGFYVVQLIASDGELLSRPTTLIFEAQNTPPTANAGAAQSVFKNDLVSLDGSASSDPDGDDLTYLWVFSDKPEGSQAVLTDAETVSPTFVADLKGDYVLTLVVNDGFADSESDNVTITVQNRAPIAIATGTADGFVGDVIMLSGAGSSDPDGDALTYLWTVQGPEGSMALLSDPNAASPMLTPDVGGVYSFTLVVNDGEVSSPPASFASTISDANRPPVLAPVGDQSIILGASVSFTISGTDVNGDDLSYFIDTLPLPKGASFDAVSGQFNFRPLSAQPELYTLNFGVSDGTLTDTETVTFSVVSDLGETSLTGRVVDADTGAPIVNAMVKVEEKFAFTDSNGVFFIVAPAVGFQEICVFPETNSVASNGQPYVGNNQYFTIIAGVENNLDQDIALSTALESDPIVADQPTVITNAEFDVSLTVPANSARAVVSSPEARYWRLFINELVGNGVSGNRFTISEMDFRGTVGGPSLFGGGQISSTATFSGSPERLIDKDIGTSWSSSGRGFGVWVAYDFGLGNEVAVNEVALTSNGSAVLANNRAPKDFELQYSSDGETWEVATRYDNELDWGVSETRNYDPQIDYTETVSLSGLEQSDLDFLPEGTVPCQMFSVGPKNIRFKDTITLSVANNDNLPVGALADVLAFKGRALERIGTATVSADGTRLEAEVSGLQGGMLVALSPRAHSLALSAEQPGGMFVPSLLGEGNLQTSYSLPAYSSLGSQRAVTLVYNSQSANPDIAVSVNSTFGNGAIPQTLISRVEAGGVTQEFEDYINVDSNDTVSQSAIISAGNVVSGRVPYRFLSIAKYACSNVTAALDDSVYINNKKDSPFGSGWDLPELQSLDVSDEGVTIVDGTGTSVSFSDLVPDLDEGFDDGFGGWQVLNDVASFTFESVGGNPNGYLEFTDAVAGDVVYWQAPAEFANRVRDYRGGSINFDLRQNAVTSQFESFGDIIIETSEGTNRLFLDWPTSQNPGTAWTSYSYPLQFDLSAANGARWIISPAPGQQVTDVTEEEVLNLLGKATKILIRAEYRAGSDTGGIDNVSLRRGESIAAPDDVTTRPDFVIAAAFEGDDGDFTRLYQGENGTFIRRYPNGTQSIFNSDGRQSEIIDRNGNATRYAYDAQGRVTTITDPVGLVTEFVYVGRNLSSIKDPSGKETFFAYDSNGNLARVENPEGEVTSYDYDKNQRLTGETDRRGLTTSHEYGAAGAYLGAERPDGTNVGLGIAKSLGLGSLGTPEQPRNAILPEDRISKFSDGRGNETFTKVNGFGSIIQFEDPLGRETFYERNSDNLVTAIIAPSSVTPDGTIRTELEYDDNGFVIRKIEAVGTSLEREEIFEYEPQFSRLIRSVDADGFETLMAYDANGNVIRITDPLGGEELSTYNNQGLITSKTDKNGNVTTFSYDLFGRLERITDPNNVTTRMVLSPEGNILLQIDAEGTALERRTTMSYDSLNRKVNKIAADGGISIYEYNGNDNVIKLTDATGVIGTRIYDDRNRVVSINDPATGEKNIAYDEDSNITRITDAAGNDTEFTYNSVDKLISSIDSKGQLRAFTYDIRDNITGITDARANVTFVSYDELDRPRNRTNSAGETWALTYDGRDNRLRATKPDGTVITSVYDGLSRLKSLSGGDIARDYSYDPHNNILVANDNSNGVTGVTISSTYDNENRLETTSVANLFGRAETNNTFAYGYDFLDRRSNMTDSFGAITSYSYDAVDRLISVTAPQGDDFDINYDLAGRLLARTAPNTTVMIRQYEPATGRLSSQRQEAGGVNFNGFNYAYTKRGNIEAITESGEVIRQRHYSYDELERLTEVRVPASPFQDEIYMLDPEGNRISSHLSDMYQTDETNRLRADINYTYVYDLNGNLTSKLAKAGTGLSNWDYSYDTLDQLIEVSQDGNPVERYRYDAFGRRSVIETVNSLGGLDMLAIVNDGSDRAIDVTQGVLGQALPIRRYTHSGNVDEQLQVETFDETGRFDARYIYHADHLGSIRYLTDSSGTIVNAYDYDSHGRPMFGITAFDQPFAYTGREWDQATGLYHYRARAYDAETGRFLQEDPIGFTAGDLNVYRYVQSNPLTYVDPSGMNNALSYAHMSQEGFKNGGTIGSTAAIGSGALLLGVAIALNNIDDSWLAFEDGRKPRFRGDNGGPPEGPFSGIPIWWDPDKLVIDDRTLHNNPLYHFNQQLEFQKGLGDMMNGDFGRMAGEGTNTPLRDEARLIARYGGEPGGWSKVYTKTQHGEVHAYHYGGRFFEPKPKFNNNNLGRFER